ncbi:hypothetical protein BH24DEI2_BH24DEI2_06100 [soil metagenome]
MRRTPLFFLAALMLLGLGYGAYTLGRLAAKPELGGTALQNPVDVREVTLTGADGRTVTFGDFEGETVLVFFGYTRCPDVCPVTLARLAKLYHDAGEPTGLKIVMVTVDPANDTPEVAQQYAASFQPDFVGLGGSNAQIAAAAKTFFVGLGANGEPIAHTDAVFLVDRQGEFRTVYSQANLEALAADLASLGGRPRKPG